MPPSQGDWDEYLFFYLTNKYSFFFDGNRFFRKKMNARIVGNFQRDSFSSEKMKKNGLNSRL